MKRWTRNAKDFEYVAESSSNLFGTQVGSSVLYVNALEAVQAVQNDPDAAEILMKYLANAKKEIQRMVDERHIGSENMVTSAYSSDSGSEGIETDFDDVNANTYGASGSSAYMSDADIRAIQAPTVRNPVGRPRQNKYPRMFERFKKVMEKRLDDGKFDHILNLLHLKKCKYQCSLFSSPDGYCDHCDEEGHTCRTCKLKAAKKRCSKLTVATSKSARKCKN
jgi:hypothetical protein